MTNGYDSLRPIAALLIVCVSGCASTPARHTSEADPPAPVVHVDLKTATLQPWLDAFVAQVRGNWFIPMSALSRQGRVVIAFHLEKDGRILNVTLKESSGVDGFDKSALWAISASDPTQPLPADYPDAGAPFTTTFHFNTAPK